MATNQTAAPSGVQVSSAQLLAGTVQQAPAGAQGIDTTNVLQSADVQALVANGYQFCIRYVHRVAEGESNAVLTTAEANVILQGGLALMVVQYFAGDGWAPNGSLGTSYGSYAASSCQEIGVPPGVNVWCDLESVSSSAQDVIDYCNNWYDAVQAAGYVPGLYVGYDCGLNPQQLYDLKFEHYWSSYNLNLDQYPAVRGVQMRQLADSGPIGEYGGDHDEDVTQTDNLGGNAVWLAPAAA